MKLVRLVATIATLFASSATLVAQRFPLEVSPTILPNGTTIEHRLYLSHNKLRRGTTLQIEIETFHKDSCMNIAQDPATDRQKPRLEFDRIHGLSEQGPKFYDPGPGGRAVGDTVVKECVTGSLSMSIKAKANLKPGTYQVHGKLIWQPVTANGIQPVQTTDWSFPIEVVDKGDRSVQFDSYFGKDMSGWKYVVGAPLMPAYLVGCLSPEFRSKYCTD